MLLRTRLLTIHASYLILSSPTYLSLTHTPKPFSQTFRQTYSRPTSARTPRTNKPPISDKSNFIKSNLFVSLGVDPEQVAEDMVLPGSNIVHGPYAGHSQIKEVEFIKSSSKTKDNSLRVVARPRIAILGRSNVRKSSLINALCHKKEVAITPKKPGKTQLINHFLVNKSWYIVDLPGYGFANAPESTRMDWSSFTKGYFLNRETLVALLLPVDASIPARKIDIDCANWLGRHNIPMTFVFTKCDKGKAKKGNLHHGS